MSNQSLATYLERLAVITGIPASELGLYRGDILIDNLWGGETKPDEGYSSPLEYYYLRQGRQWIASFGLYQFPSCCAFCVSTAASVVERHRRKGVNTLLNQLRQEIARLHGYTAIICTDVAGNIGERRTLAKEGWSDLYSVVNKRTKNQVIISIKEL